MEHQIVVHRTRPLTTVVLSGARHTRQKKTTASVPPPHHVLIYGVADSQYYSSSWLLCWYYLPHAPRPKRPACGTSGYSIKRSSQVLQLAWHACCAPPSTRLDSSLSTSLPHCIRVDPRDSIPNAQTPGFVRTITMPHDFKCIHSVVIGRLVKGTLRPLTRVHASPPPATPTPPKQPKEGKKKKN